MTEEDKIREKIKKLENKEKAIRFQNEANNNPILQQSGKVVVNKGQIDLWKILGSLFIISIIIYLGIFAYLIKENKLKTVVDIAMQPNFNATIFNNYTFNNDINNDYKFDNNNTFTIINNIFTNST